MIEEKHSREKQLEKMLDGSTNSIKVGQVTDALNVMTDQDGWKIVYAKEQGTRLIA